MFPSDRTVSIDTSMPLDYFHLVEHLLFLWRKKLILSTQISIQACYFFSSVTNIPLFLQTEPVMFDIVGFSFPSTFSLSSSLSHFLSTYLAVKLYCSLRL